MAGYWKTSEDRGSYDVDNWCCNDHNFLASNDPRGDSVKVKVALDFDISPETAERVAADPDGPSRIAQIIEEVCAMLFKKEAEARGELQGSPQRIQH
nr:hypothetical protein [Armatimonas sp.]